MYMNQSENVEVYFICYKKEDMELVEVYYDEVLDVHCWYFNAYLAYKYWKDDFKNLEIGLIVRMLLIVAASRYLLYKLEDCDFESEEEHKGLLKDLEKIEPLLDEIIDENMSFLKDKI